DKTRRVFCHTRRLCCPILPSKKAINNFSTYSVYRGRSLRPCKR
ncbi:sulfite Synthesis/biphosphate phosphatase domain protein, partial [Chlamydia psittaci 08-2626_L3]